MRPLRKTVMVREWLKALAIVEIRQWDVLVFLHRHRTVLLSAEQIARLMCYGPASIVTALDNLESLGMVARSRLSRGVRLYQLIELDGPRSHAFQELMALTESRVGWLEIHEKLRKASSHTAAVLTVRPVKLPRQRNRSLLSKTSSLAVTEVHNVQKQSS